MLPDQVKRKRGGLLPLGYTVPGTTDAILVVWDRDDPPVLRCTTTGLPLGPPGTLDGLASSTRAHLSVLL